MIDTRPQTDNEIQTRDNASHAKTSDRTYRPPMDLYDLGDRFEIRVDLPGATADSIELTVDRGVLTVEAEVEPRWSADAQPLHAEYGVGRFRRQVRLSEDVDAEALSADYALGVLTVGLPKHARTRPRKIEVRAG